MSTGDTSSARSLNRANDREILEGDAQAGSASSDTVVSQEHTDFLTGDSERSLILRTLSIGTNRCLQARVSNNDQRQHGQGLVPSDSLLTRAVVEAPSRP